MDNEGGDSSNSLHKALKEGSLEEITRIIEDAENKREVLMSIDDQGQTVLHCLCSDEQRSNEERLQILQLLLSKLPDQDDRDELILKVREVPKITDRRTVLHYACEKFDIPECIRMLFENLSESRRQELIENSECGWSAIYYTENCDVLSLIFETCTDDRRQAFLEQDTKNENNLLHRLAWKKPGLVKILLFYLDDSGIPVYKLLKANSIGNTPLHYLISYQCEDIVRKILDRLTDEQIREILSIKNKRGDLDCFTLAAMDPNLLFDKGYQGYNKLVGYTHGSMGEYVDSLRGVSRAINDMINDYRPPAMNA